MGIQYQLWLVQALGPLIHVHLWLQNVRVDIGWEYFLFLGINTGLARIQVLHDQEGESDIFQCWL